MEVFRSNMMDAQKSLMMGRSVGVVPVAWWGEAADDPDLMIILEDYEVDPQAVDTGITTIQNPPPNCFFLFFF
jgi:hypothetical protein